VAVLVAHLRAVAWWSAQAALIVACFRTVGLARTELRVFLLMFDVCVQRYSGSRSEATGSWCRGIAQSIGKIDLRPEVSFGGCPCVDDVMC
jgi:hypothetical protein